MHSGAPANPVKNIGTTYLGFRLGMRTLWRRRVDRSLGFENAFTAAHHGVKITMRRIPFNIVYRPLKN
jgi:hypothetical protein